LADRLRQARAPSSHTASSTGATGQDEAGCSPLGSGRATCSGDTIRLKTASASAWTPRSSPATSTGPPAPDISFAWGKVTRKTTPRGSGVSAGGRGRPASAGAAGFGARLAGQTHSGNGSQVGATVASPGKSSNPARVAASTAPRRAGPPLRTSSQATSP